MEFLMTMIALALLMFLNGIAAKKQTNAGLLKAKADAFFDSGAATGR